MPYLTVPSQSPYDFPLPQRCRLVSNDFGPCFNFSIQSFIHTVYILDKDIKESTSDIKRRSKLGVKLMFTVLITVCSKKVSPKVVCNFLSNHLAFLREILHLYYLFIYT